MIDVVKSALLLLVLLNPFLVIVYLIDVLQKRSQREFSLILLRAGLIATVVFLCFSLVGDHVFKDIIQAEFASFQIFGGVVFLLISLQFVFRGPKAITMLRGDADDLASAIAMPILVGPGTISASVLIGKRLSPGSGCVAIVAAMATTVVVMILLKQLHDIVKPRREQLVERYIEISGRVTALFVGTVSIEMIMRGIDSWIDKF